MRPQTRNARRPCAGCRARWHGRSTRVRWRRRTCSRRLRSCLGPHVCLERLRLLGRVVVGDDGGNAADANGQCEEPAHLRGRAAPPHDRSPSYEEHEADELAYVELRLLAVAGYHVGYIPCCQPVTGRTAACRGGEPRTPEALEARRPERRSRAGETLGVCTEFFVERTPRAPGPHTCTEIAHTVMSDNRTFVRAFQATG